MKNRHFLMWTFAVFAASLLVASPPVWADDDDDDDDKRKRLSLAGSWLVNSPLGIRGVETMTPLDKKGRKVAVRISSVSADATALGCCPEAEYLSDGIGNAAMTGRSTFEATLLQYSMRAPTEEECAASDCRDQVVCIWVADVVGTLTETTQESATTFTIYPTSDADLDMLPDDCDAPCAIPAIPGNPTSVTLPVNAQRIPEAPCE